MKNVYAKVEKFMRDRKMLGEEDTVLLAVSGGPDSVFLLHFFVYLAQKKKIKVNIAYIHHHLRKEADKELPFVKRLAGTNSFPFYFRDIEIENKRSIEEQARVKRYQALDNIARDTGCSKIAVGHTLDDQAETVLMHLVKGTGLGGLRGMLPVSGVLQGSPVLLIRPLLCIEKSVILECLEKAGREYKVDSSNLSGEFFRNKIRNELIPLLKTYNRNVVKQLARSALLLQEDFRFLQKTADRSLDNICRETGNGINMRNYKNLDLSIKRMVVSSLIERFTGNTYRSFAAIEKARLRLEKVNSEYLTMEELDNIIQDRPLQNRIKKDIPKTVLTVPGEVFLQDGRKVTAELTVFSPDIFKNNDRFTCYLDAERVGGLLEIKSYKKGDFFSPLGMSRKKKLSRLFIDRKIPCGKRSDYPVFETRGEIVWVCGVEISDKYKVKSKTRKVLKLKVSP